MRKRNELFNFNQLALARPRFTRRDSTAVREKLRGKMKRFRKIFHASAVDDETRVPRKPISKNVVWYHRDGIRDRGVGGGEGEGEEEDRNIGPLPHRGCPYDR